MEIVSSAVSGCNHAIAIAITCSLKKAKVKMGIAKQLQEQGPPIPNPLKKPKRVEPVKKLFKNLAFPPLVAALVTLSPIPIPIPIGCNINPYPAALAQSIEIQRGAALFRQACIGCHDGGGNIIQPGATLFKDDLQRNGVDTEEEIYRITYFGKGRMPGFGESCTPRGQCTFGPRLKEDEIKILAEFVKLQADQGWPNIPSNED